MTLAFIWYFNRASEIMPHWRDGLRAALEYLAKEHTVLWYLDEKVPQKHEVYDAILIWGDSNCPVLSYLSTLPGKKGICLSTNPHNIENLKNVDAVFCESTVVYEEARRHGLRAVKAFGTDTDFFTPEKTKKDIEYFYPATFSPWKRQGSIAKLGSKLLCLGTVQPDGEEELEECRKKGVRVEVGYFPPEKIKEYYNRAQNIIIPAIHGSERTVLEAMSMDILPIVNPDNEKAHSYIKEYNSSGAYSPRDFVVDNYSHKDYAEQLLKGLQ